MVADDFFTPVATYTLSFKTSHFPFRPLTRLLDFYRWKQHRHTIHRQFAGIENIVWFRKGAACRLDSLFGIWPSCGQFFAPKVHTKQLSSSGQSTGALAHLYDGPLGTINLLRNRLNSKKTWKDSCHTLNNRAVVFRWSFSQQPYSFCKEWVAWCSWT